MANPLHVRQRLNLAITRPDGQFRILSLDGGGTKGLIETAALQRLYPGMGGREILKKFDLVIGTSAGSMLIAALLTNAPLDVVLSEMTATHDAIFKTRTPSFCSLPGIGAYIQSLIVAPLAKYWQSAKQPGLRMVRLVSKLRV